MIQVEVWAAATVIIIALLSVVYFFYFKISTKFFPQSIDFASKLSPKEGKPIIDIKGSGILKIVEISTNENCIIAITVDGVNKTLFAINSDGSTNRFELKKETSELSIREQLNQKFSKNCAIHIQNQALQSLDYKGNVRFEAKKGLGTTIRAVLSEMSGKRRLIDN